MTLETHPPAYPASSEKPQPADTPKVVHEETGFVVVDKPSGLLSVPGRGPGKHVCLSAMVKAAYPGCIDQPAVHRLDRDTSGLMVFALTKPFHRNLSIQFQNREPQKQYIALLEGELTEAGGVLQLPFRLDIDNRPIQIYDPVQGKVGITRWKNLTIENGRTRVLFTPLTGRTHQLRVHAAHERGLGHPIVGDSLYGNTPGAERLKLHACDLRFRHPVTQEHLSFHSPAPF